MFGQLFGEAAFGQVTELRITVRTSTRISINSDYRIYVSDEESITGADDAPANQPFAGSFDEPVSFEWSVLGGDFVGGFATGKGESQIVNTDKTYDFIPARYALDGREFEIRFGRTTDRYVDSLVSCKGVVSDFHVNKDALRITLEDYGYKLDVPAQAKVYSGAGGINGGADLAGKPIPRALGYVLNVTPPLVYPNLQLYQVNDGAVNDITAVYDKGFPLARGADFATVALLLASTTIPASTYATCIAQGYFRLNETLAGAVTCDVEGDATGGMFATTTAAIVRRLVVLATELRDPVDLYLPAFVLLDTLQPAPVGYWISHNDTISVSDVVAKLMLGIGAFAGFRRNGKFSVMRLDAPAGAPLKRFDLTGVSSPDREPLPAGINPPPPRWRIGYQRNWTVIADPAGGVTDMRRSFLAADYRYGLAESAAIRIDHPFAKDRDPVEGFFRLQADADAEALRRLVLFRATRALYTFAADIRDGIQLNWGDKIMLTDDRWDLSQGRLMIVLRIQQNGKAGTLDMLAYG